MRARDHAQRPDDYDAWADIPHAKYGCSRRAAPALRVANVATAVASGPRRGSGEEWGGVDGRGCRGRASVDGDVGGGGGGGAGAGAGAGGIGARAGAGAGRRGLRCRQRRLLLLQLHPPEVELHPTELVILISDRRLAQGVYELPRCRWPPGVTAGTSPSRWYTTTQRR
jgi:hypothetical protein